MRGWPEGVDERSRLRDVLCLSAVLKSVFWRVLVMGTNLDYLGGFTMMIDAPNFS